MMFLSESLVVAFRKPLAKGIFRVLFVIKRRRILDNQVAAYVCNKDSFV
jgi:hypothetical protein